MVIVDSSDMSSKFLGLLSAEGLHNGGELLPLPVDLVLLSTGQVVGDLTRGGFDDLHLGSGLEVVEVLDEGPDVGVATLNAAEIFVEDLINF